ncbi:SapC family protein [Aquabacterium sp. OR-4]|uniref:SapC family protein n=1 Tax=Aquabacterium sp. OR-4 TaxID=2978127 RepID=UPI0021B26072|nr:SapC family protein [Aquabacterium sp. OR-4]MDT7836156.1 SapC family protein [Aquabacterium sp. OR-4]
MINENLHKKPVALDRVKHKDLKLDLQHRDLGTVGKLNAFFVAGTEFGDACREYPVVWVHAGNDEAGKQLVAPIAVFGLKAEQNLCIDNDKWRVRYVPAALRLYPFGLARVAPDQMVVCFDETWGGFGTSGETLFNADGGPTEFVANVQKQLENFEVEVERTRAVGNLLVEKGLLRDMRFDATLPDGSKLAVDGFLTVDADKLAALSDADLLAMNKNGVMGLIHAHQISLGNMTRLVEWYVERFGTAAPATA